MGISYLHYIFVKRKTDKIQKTHTNAYGIVTWSPAGDWNGLPALTDGETNSSDGGIRLLAAFNSADSRTGDDGGETTLISMP